MKKFLLSCSLALGIGASAQTTVFFDDFESYPNFTITNFGDWTQTDLDGGTTWALQDVTFPNQGYVGAGIIFNNTLATGTAVSATMNAYSGQKGLYFFASGANSTTYPNNDWTISPKISLTGLSGTNKLELYAKGLQHPSYGPDQFNIAVSTTDTNVSSFTKLNSTPVLPSSTAWTKYEFDLSAYSGQEIYIAINCVTNDGLYLLIDDFKVINTPPATVAPDCATLTSPTNNNTAVVPGSVTLSWTAPTTGGTPSSYDVYFGTSANPTTLLGNVTTTSITATTSPTTTYYWKVVPKNTVGVATGCSEYTFTTVVPVYCTTTPNNQWPTAALNPTTCNGTTAVNGTNVWAGEYSVVNVVAGRTYKFETILQPNYYITIATNVAAPVGLASGTGIVTYTATTTGTVRFISHTNSSCGSGTTATAHTRRVTCMGTMAVSDIDKKDISVYPNPFTDVLKISDVKGVKSVSVNDISGREVKSLAPSAELNLSSLKAGLYIVNLKMEDGSVKTFKAIKK